MKRLFACVLPAPVAVVAQDTGGFAQALFTGEYRMIGQGAGGPVDVALRLDPVGAHLGVTLCGVADGGGLVLPSQSGGDPYIQDRIGAGDVVCDPFMTSENYPLLACHSDTGSLLTLWRGADFAAALECGA